VAYYAKRKELRIAIWEAQAKSGADLCQAADADPWGLPYKVVMKKIGRRRPGLEASGREKAIADHMFPAHPATDWFQEPPLTDDEQRTPE